MLAENAGSGQSDDSRKNDVDVVQVSHRLTPTRIGVGRSRLPSVTVRFARSSPDKVPREARLSILPASRELTVFSEMTMPSNIRTNTCLSVITIRSRAAAAWLSDA